LIPCTTHAASFTLSSRRLAIFSSRVVVLNCWEKSTLVSLCDLYELIFFFCIAQCIDLVDYYTPIFLSEVASLKPREFCHEINICQLVEHVSVQVQEDACGFCEETVSTLLDKLKDSDTKVSNFIFLL